MAAVGYTPIQLYRTATAAAVPVAGNLNNGELAINYNAADMALYAKNGSGSVIKLINNPAGLTYPSADGSAGALLRTNGSTTLSFSTVIYDTGTNVGIGTSSPAKKLDVNGDASLNGVTAGRGGGNLASNTAFGANALSANVGGGYSTAIGYGAAGTTTTVVSSCTAIGYNSCIYGSSYAVAVGALSLNASTGQNNTALGYAAGQYIVGGSNNTLLGYGSSTSSATSTYQIVIGSSCTGFGDNYVTIGASGTNNIYAQFNTSATWTKASDERIKRNIQSSNLGLSFINKLRPVTFQWKPNTEYPTNIAGYDKDNNTQDLDAVMHGMIAQEVKAALDSEGVEHFAGWNERPSDGLQGVSNEMFVLPLINAVKELKAELDALRTELQALKGN